MAGIEYFVKGAIGNLLITLAIAGVFKLISSLISTENRFKALFAVTLYSMIAVSIVQSVAMVLVIISRIQGDHGHRDEFNSSLKSGISALQAFVKGEDALPKFLMRLL